MKEQWTWLHGETRNLPEPDNLYAGQRLPDNFELPDNILLFYHDFCAPAPNAHHRYTLVFPFADMQYYVDQIQYDLHGGKILLLRPYQLRFLSPNSAGYQRFFITFTLKNGQSYLPESCVCEPDESSFRYLEQILHETDPQELAIALYHFLASLSQSSHAESTSKKMSPQIANAIRFIHENLNHPLNNQSIANAVNMSESNLRRRFRQETGLSLKSYVNKQRLDIASYYLKETLMRVEEIAALCGFSSLFSFSHFFKFATGCSPAQFRRNETH